MLSNQQIGADDRNLLLLMIKVSNQKPSTKNLTYYVPDILFKYTILINGDSTNITSWSCFVHFL